ncbi:regulator of G protein signaling superfamily, partial [Zopfia rhizophila CBS 207.26]
VKLAQQLRPPRPVQFCSCPGFDEKNKSNARRVYKELWRSVMSTRKIGAPALSIRTSSSIASSPTSSTADAEDEMAMDTDYQPSRPLTVSIPKNVPGPCQRRPNLSEILANTAPLPYSLSAFMAYMSQNHCLETLEFTMDCSRYRKHYSKMVNRTPNSPISPLSDECTYVKMLFTRLLDAYIAPNGPREVNLPSDVRDHLLSLSDSYVPPHPSTLDPAVSKIYELMEESVLVPFLNSVCPQSSIEPGFENYDGVLKRSHTRSYDDDKGAVFRTRSHQPQPPTHQRASAPSSLITSHFMHPKPFSHSRFNSQPTTSSSPSTRVTPGYGSPSDLTDDSGSASAGSPSGFDPLTPPGTPPMTDFNQYQDYYENGTHSGTPSPRTSRGEHNGLAGARDSWKRVSSKLWPRKRSGGALREEEQGAVEGGLF